MEKSVSIQNIGKALALFNMKMGKITKDKTNPFFKSSYATLSTILEHIQLPLIECNLAITQFPTENNTLTTILIHSESGEYIQGSYSLSPIKNDPQSIGSAITYARRYALGAVLGLNIDDDDDGNKATFGNAKSKQAPPKLPELNPANPKWTGAVNALLNSQTTISKIQAQYYISPENIALLTKSTIQ